eukprot:8001377-Alexandrium_andersonii.AAC.1
MTTGPASSSSAWPTSFPATPGRSSSRAWLARRRRTCRLPHPLRPLEPTRGARCPRRSTPSRRRRSTSEASRRRALSRR